MHLVFRIATKFFTDGFESLAQYWGVVIVERRFYVMETLYGKGSFNHKREKLREKIKREKQEGRVGTMDATLPSSFSTLNC